MLEELIKRDNITVRDLSLYTGVCKKTIRNIINNKRVPRLSTVKKIAGYFKVPVKIIWRVK